MCVRVRVRVRVHVRVHMYACACACAVFACSVGMSLTFFLMSGALVAPTEKLKKVDWDGVVDAYAAVSAGSKEKFILKPNGLENKL